MAINNVGRAEATVRVLLGLGLLGVAAVLNDRPLLAVGVGFLAVVVIGTGLFRVCPLYTALGLKTR